MTRLLNACINAALFILFATLVLGSTVGRDEPPPQATTAPAAALPSPPIQKGTAVIHHAPAAAGGTR